MVMDSKDYQKQYRRNRENKGWKYLSIMIPSECYIDIKKFYLRWKSDNLHLWDKEKK